MHIYYFEVWHLKYLYVIILFAGREKYPRGRRGGFAKALGRATGAGVRIPPSPPKQIKKSRKDVFRDFFIFVKPNLLQKIRQDMQLTGIHLYPFGDAVFIVR